MWFLRRMLRISWIEKISNDEVTRRAGVTPSLINTVRRRQMNYVGHVYRKDGIENTSMTGKIEGKRGRGKQRLTYHLSLNNWATNNQMNNTCKPSQNSRKSTGLEGYDRRCLQQTRHLMMMMMMMMIYCCKP